MSSKIIAEREFRDELAKLLHKFSREHGSNTPDFILARFIMDSVIAFDRAAGTRDIWYEHHCPSDLKEQIQAHGRAQPDPTGKDTDAS